MKKYLFGAKLFISQKKKKNPPKKLQCESWISKANLYLFWNGAMIKMPYVCIKAIVSQRKRFALIQWVRLWQKKKVTNQWLCFSTNWLFHSSAFHTHILCVDTSMSRSKTEQREGKIQFLCTIILVLNCCNWIAQIKQQTCPFMSRNQKYQLQVWNLYESNIFWVEKSHWKLLCQSCKTD